MTSYGYSADQITEKPNERSGYQDNTKQPWQSQYPHVLVKLFDKAGNLIDSDSTPGAERLRFRHTSGSGIEWLYDGATVIHSVGNKYEYIKGGVTKTIERGLDQKVAGIERTMSEGKHTETNGNFSHAITGNHAMAAKNSTMRMLENFNLGSEKSITLNSGGNKSKITMNSDGGLTITAEGDISFQSNGKIAFKGAEFHASASQMNLGYDNLKISDIHLLNITVGYAKNALQSITAGSLGGSATYPGGGQDSNGTTTGAEAQTHDGVMSSNQNKTLADWQGNNDSGVSTG